MAAPETGFMLELDLVDQYDIYGYLKTNYLSIKKPFFEKSN